MVHRDYSEEKRKFRHIYCMAKSKKNQVAIDFNSLRAGRRDTSGATRTRVADTGEDKRYDRKKFKKFDRNYDESLSFRTFLDQDGAS